MNEMQRSQRGNATQATRYHCPRTKVAVIMMAALRVERILQLLQEVKLERLIGDCLGLGVGKQDSPTNGRREFAGEGGGRFLKLDCRTSLVVQWLRAPLPMQGTSVLALVREDPMCCGSVGPCTTPAEPTCCAPEARAP